MGGLRLHTDDSEITLNVCVDDAFEGGQLRVFNVRGKEYVGSDNAHLRDASDLETRIQPRKGYAVLHRGRQFHSVSEVVSGRRVALIVWFRSLKGLRREVCPCCWLTASRIYCSGSGG